MYTYKSIDEIERLNQMLRSGVIPTNFKQQVAAKRNRKLIIDIRLESFKTFTFCRANIVVPRFCELAVSVTILFTESMCKMGPRFF